MIKRATAALAAVAAVAAVAAPAATAQDVEINGAVLEQPYHPCLTQITVPNCVNWALDTAESEVEALRDTYNEDVQPQIDRQTCKVHYILTGEPCSVRAPMLP